MQHNDRMPAVGDLIIHKPQGFVGSSHVGVVTKIDWGPSGTGNAFVRWASFNPHYNREHGLSCYNIHNCYNEFEVIKK